MPHRLIRYLYYGLVLLGLLLSQGTHAGVEITYIHNDALGTPVAGTDAQGRVKWRAHYQPWGGEVLGERQPTGLRAGYTGHREDAATGLTYMGARYYSPRLGRFMGVDPAGVREGSVHSFNRYAYANNNPYKYVDPDGESPLDVGFLLVDSVKLAIAIQSGIGVGAAAGDFAASVFGVVSPLPGLGQAIKAGRLSSKIGRVAKGLINPSKIRFSQNSIKGTFRDGRSIDDLVKGLRDGSIKPSDVPAIRTVERKGQLISIDNRRLAAFKEAGVPIRTRPATTAEIAQAQKQGKFSAGPSGSGTIRIRGR